ncbi:MAG: hypothetical protein R3Y12_00870 [Clostridia bacterium]
MPSIIKNVGDLPPITGSVKIPEIRPKDIDENEMYIPEEGENLENSENSHHSEQIEEVEEIGEVLTEEQELELAEKQEEERRLARLEAIQEKITKEELAQLYKKELEEVRIVTTKNAYKSAYKSAYEKAYEDTIFQRRGEIQECIKRVDEGLLEMQQYHKQFLGKYAVELKYLAIDVAEKMIMHKINEDDLVLERLVKKTVIDIKNTSWFDIEISDKLVNLVEKLRRDLENEIPNARVTISPKPIPIDSVRVNAEEGTVVSSISAQAENLATIFDKTEE